MEREAERWVAKPVFDTGTGVSVDEWFMQKIEKERK